MGSKRKRTSKEAGTGTSNQPSNKRPKSTADPSEAPPTRPEAPELIEKSPFVENPTGDERKREAYLYDFLGSEDVNERINAADVIVSSLFAEECVPEPILVRHLEQRLFRGLVSGRKASRLGFSLVITEILGQLFGEKDLAASSYPELSFEKVLGIVLEKTDASGNLPGLAERDHYYGQLFGIECFVRAGILFGEKSRWTQVLDLLVKMSQKKVWLRRQCGWIILQAIPHMKRKTAEKVLEKLVEEGLAQTSEGVAIWLLAVAKFPKLKAPSKPWQDPLMSSSFASLPTILKDSGRDNTITETPEAQSQKQNNWTAQLHFVWDYILASFILRADAAEKETAELFKQFWTRVVDEGFFSKTASEAQKFSGFMVFQLFLEGHHDSFFIVKNIFSKNLMACLMNQSAKEDRYLHRAAVKALKAVETEVERWPQLLEPVLKNLLGNHGAYNFDQRTSSKTVEKILQTTTAENAKAVLSILKLKDPSKIDLEYPKYLQALGNYLLKLASLPSPASESTKKSDLSVPAHALVALIEVAYSATEVPETVREAFRIKVTSAFSKFVQRPEDFGQLCHLILSIKAPETEDEELLSASNGAVERLRKLLGAKKETPATKALALLHAVALLQYYNEDPDSLDLFQELEECYTKLGNGKMKRGEEGTAEFLVEILLAMVARSSSLMRQASQQVLEAFTPLMTAEAIQLLTEPLAADENEKGQQALFSTEEEDANAEEGDDDDDENVIDLDELGSDVDMADLINASAEAPGDGENQEDDADEEDQDDESGEEDSEGDEEENEQEDEELKALGDALDQVLQGHSQKKAGGAQGDDAESDMSDMTDSEMTALDEKLATVFRERAKNAGKKKARKDAKDTVVNFKHRVLDLVAVFAKKEAAASNPLAFEVAIPLLQLVRKTTVKPLSNRAQDILLGFSKGLKKARNSSAAAAAAQTAETAEVEHSVDTDALLALLGAIHTEASQDPSHAFAKAASAASVAVASVLCTSTDKADEVFQLYARTQLAWYQKDVKMQMTFFQEWLNWCQSHAAAIVPSTQTAATAE